jgi:hypothetical protein
MNDLIVEDLTADSGEGCRVGDRRRVGIGATLTPT